MTPIPDEEEAEMAVYRYEAEAKDSSEVIGGEVEAADFWSAIRAVEARLGTLRPWTLTVWDAEERAGRDARGDW
jgi:hypothetical protein